ncbi:MAG TPA: heparan-alpha-glucosaminide N-acetyltransferase domain-containing protein [Burkholderiaceae bacterium]|nr:heparan-alpha-glucosaminide N-acetyltransferase domain-containing protein [Burkholderiaceae bacterium]
MLTNTSHASPRSAALDALRGAAVALMILVNNPGSWGHIYPPLAHAAWHGVTPTDLVFPFFLCAVGASMAFALDAAAPARAFWPKVLQRAAIIFALGLFLNASPFVRWSAAGELVARDWPSLRVMGVLQRIALAYLGAAVVVRLVGLHRAWLAAALLLLAYWVACVTLATGPDPYSLEGFFGTALDRALLGPAHLYPGEGVPFDPEGLASTWPAIAQVLLGAAAGRWLQRGPADAALALRLFVAAALLLALGYAWALAMPLNKKLWTSSYVVHTTGLALATLALLVTALDLRGRRGAALTLAIAFGRNALLVFFLSGLVPRVLALIRWRDGDAWTSPLRWAYEHAFAWIPGDPRLGSLAYALAVLAAFAVVAAALDRRRWYWRA